VVRGFSKVGAHDDQEFVADGVGHRLEAVGIFVGGVGIMNRAGADNHDEPVHVTAVQDVPDRLSRLKHQLGHLVADRQLRFDIAGRGERFNLYDMLIIDRPVHACPFERSV
jgi:hypothetical protein